MLTYETIREITMDYKKELKEIKNDMERRCLASAENCFQQFLIHLVNY